MAAGFSSYCMSNISPASFTNGITYCLVLVRGYSSFEIFIGHLILMIFFKHTRWNLSSLSSTVPVILHNSVPYSRTGSTLLWNKRSFVFLLYDSDFHTFPRILKEFLAFQSLFLMSASAPSSFVTVDLFGILSLIRRSLCYPVFLL